jgi:oligopeptide transport system substrate-binding protein
LEAADVNPDQHARLQTYMQAEQQLVNDVAWLPIDQEETNLVLKPYVKGLSFNAMDVIAPDDWRDVNIAAH